MLKVGLVGFGGVARVHKRAYETIMKEENPAVELVSIFDVNAAQFTKTISINIAAEESLDLSAYHLYDDLDKMLENEQLDLLDVCVPTFLHCDIVTKLLLRGYNVYCEKPMAMTVAEADKMMEAKFASGKRLLIGHPLRFIDSSHITRELIVSGKYGKVRDAVFHRLSATPRWNAWLLNPDKSGGCILDMHMHDIDLARFFFGDPSAVSTVSNHTVSRYDTNHTTMFYDGFSAHLTGDWSFAATFPFSSGYRISLDGATIVLDGATLTVYPEEGEPYTPACPQNDGMEGAIRYFADILASGAPNTTNPSVSSAQTIHIIDKMKKSANLGGAVIPCDDLPYKN